MRECVVDPHVWTHNGIRSRMNTISIIAERRQPPTLRRGRPSEAKAYSATTSFDDIS
jgi:hypothetical protein